MSDNAGMKTSRLPTLFISHGAPTFALEPGLAGANLTALGRTLPRPEAVLVVSPHWMTRGLRVATTAHPETVHDFGGFDPALYEIRYPAAGHPHLAQRALELLRAAGLDAQDDPHHGLDHGAWVPLLHLYAQADVPVFQVSLPTMFDEDAAWALGRALASLTQEGALIVGSGSLTHNLHDVFAGDGREQPYVAEFVSWVHEAVHAGDGDRLRHALRDAPNARRAHPTTDHFLPLLVAAGAAPMEGHWRVLEGGIDYGVLSMDSFVFGADPHPTS